MNMDRLLEEDGLKKKTKKRKVVNRVKEASKPEQDKEKPKEKKKVWGSGFLRLLGKK